MDGMGVEADGKGVGADGMGVEANGTGGSPQLGGPLRRSRVSRRSTRTVCAPTLPNWKPPLSRRSCPPLARARGTASEVAPVGVSAQPSPPPPDVPPPPLPTAAVAAAARAGPPARSESWAK
eukprot:938917-Prorocentrum_minimum.AAC.2